MSDDAQPKRKWSPMDDARLPEGTVIDTGELERRLRAYASAVESESVYDRNAVTLMRQAADALAEIGNRP
jgi:hypothetical protein